MSAHAPGPWRFTHEPNAKRARGKFLTVFPVGDDCPVCDVNRHRSTAEANARLIAAAPDMLAALQMTDLNLHPADNRGPCLCSQCAFRKAAKAAIAAATTEAASASQP